jgi:hypothetical protein
MVGPRSFLGWRSACSSSPSRPALQPPLVLYAQLTASVECAIEALDRYSRGLQVDKQEKLQRKWHGTDAGEALQELRRLHEALAEQSAPEQETSRERIADLVQALRQGGVYGKYDPHVGFIEEKMATKPRRKRY